MSDDRRTRSFSLGSLDLTVGLPTKTAESISRSAFYRHLLRPAARWAEGDHRNDIPNSTAVAATPDVDSSRKPWTLRDILAHPDGFLRHHRLSQLIKERHFSGTVLSVGDPFLELREHLTDFDVTSTDIIEPYLPVPDGATFLQADFRAADKHFTDRSFDLVVSTDVLEHIPSTDRARFIVQCARVARTGVFIAFPGGVHARTAEDLMLRSHRHSAFRSALLEHAQHGLPEPLDVVAALGELGLDPQLVPLTTINEWLSSFVLDPFSTAEVDLFRDYCSFLNCTAGDARTGPYYRYLVIGTKPPTKAKEALA